MAPSAPRPIALICTELRVGGAERCVTRLACGLAGERFTPRVVSLAPRPAAGEDQLVEQIEAAGVAVEFLNVTRLRHWPRARRLLRRSLCQRPVAAVQSFLFHANLLALAAAPPDVPVCTGVRVADPRRWRHWAERRASRRAAAIVCVSESVAQFCRQEAKFPADKLRVIRNGIPLAEPGPAAELPELKPPGLGGRRLLLAVGRLHHQKGYDWLLTRAGDWLEQLPEHDLAIAGEGPDREALQQQARRAGLASRVHFLGQRGDVPALLSCSELLLLPSRWEGMPNVVLEAMAARRPVLASRAEGVRELLGPDLLEPQTADFGDAEGWRRRLLALAADAELRENLGRRNRERVEREFSLEKMVDAYERLLDEVTSPR